jgi:hypothetical protein
VALKDLRTDTTRACVDALEAMKSWDQVLSTVLDGDLFSAVIGTGINHNRAASSNTTPRSGRSNSFQVHYVASDSYEPTGERAELFDGYPQGHGYSRSVSLSHSVAVAVERLGLKVERVQRLRHVFEKQAERLGNSLAQKLEAAQERVSLCLLRVGETSGRVEAARVVVDRDNKQRQQEGSEMKRFREEVGYRYPCDVVRR